VINKIKNANCKVTNVRLSIFLLIRKLLKRDAITSMDITSHKRALDKIIEDNITDMRQIRYSITSVVEIAKNINMIKGINQ